MQALLQFDVETLCLAAEVTAVLLMVAIAYAPKKVAEQESLPSSDSHWDWEPFLRVFEKAVIGIGRGICCSKESGLEATLKELYQDVPDPWRDRLTGMINAQGMDRLLQLWGERVDAASTPSTLTMFAVQSYEQLMFRRGAMATEQAIRHLGCFLLEQLSGRAILSRYQPNRFLILQFGSDTEAIMRDLNEAIQKVNAPDFFMIKDESVPLMCMSRTLPCNDGSSPPESLVTQLDETITSISGVSQNIGAEMVTPAQVSEPMKAPAASGIETEETLARTTHSTNNTEAETLPSGPLGTTEAEFSNNASKASNGSSEDEAQKTARPAGAQSEDPSGEVRGGNVFAEVDALDKLVGSGAKAIVDDATEQPARTRSNSEPSETDLSSRGSRKSSEVISEEGIDKESTQEVTEEDFSTLFDSLQSPSVSSKAVGLEFSESEDGDAEASPEEMIRQSRALAQKSGMAGAIPMTSSYTDDIEEATTKENIRTLFATVRAATQGEFAKDPSVKSISQENVDELCDVKMSDAIDAFERGLEEPDDDVAGAPTTMALDKSNCDETTGQEDETTGQEYESGQASRGSSTQEADTPESGIGMRVGKGVQPGPDEEILSSKPEKPSLESLDGDHLVSPEEIAKLFAAMRK